MARSARQSLLELDPVRSQICSDLNALGRSVTHLSVAELGRRAEALRAEALRHGLSPFARVAEGFAEALGRDGRGAIATAYLQTMRDSLFCESQDKEAGDLFLAAISVRLAC